MRTLLGLDLSTRGTAAVAAPLDWNGDWSKVSSLFVGIDLVRAATDEERARRTGEIARAVVEFARRQKAYAACIESYAYAMQSSSIYTLGELGGVVRLELIRAGIEIGSANIGTARKLLLGKVPRKGKDAKAAVRATLEAAGARFETQDEYDAFCCLNLGLSLASSKKRLVFFFGQVGA